MKKILSMYSKSNTKNSEIGLLIKGVMPNSDILDPCITGSVASTAVNWEVIISTSLVQDFTYKFANQ